MVTLFLHLEFQDSPDVILRRTAPQLPSGMMWHQGMWFLDDDDLDGCGAGYEVGCVYVDFKGDGFVHFFVKQDCNVCSEILDEFEALGWQMTY